MKNLLTVATLVFTLSNSAFATSRVNGLVSQDAKGRLDKIDQISSVLNDLELNQKSLQKDLKAALVKEDQRKIYVNGATISTNIMALTALGTTGIVVAEGGAAFISVFTSGLFGGQLYEPNIKKKLIIGGSVAAVGLVVASGALVGVYVNRNDANKILEELPKVHLKIVETQLALSKEVLQLCKAEPTHKLCY